MPAEATVPSWDAIGSHALLVAAVAWDALVAFATLAATAAGLAALLAARRALRQTTLTSAWGWTLLALGAWSAVILAAAIAGPQAAGPWLGSLGLAAVSLSFCPIVSLIGAKRPQHVTWNFVVLSLWAITALPAAEALFLQRGRPEMGDARGWFLWILIALGPINFVPTRFWLASLLVALAQVAAFSPYLPLIQRPLAPHPEVPGLLLAVAAMGAAWLIAQRETKAAWPYDRLWFDFRDRFGLFWALRVQERINAAARQYGWDLELAWSGFFRPSNGQRLTALDPALEPVLRTTLKGLLRRFVSNEWIVERLGERPGPSSSEAPQEASDS